MIFFGIIILTIGGGAIFYYSTEYNRITSDYFDKGYDAGKSGDFDSVPDLAEEEIDKKERILPICYFGAGAIFIGALVTIYGFFGKSEKTVDKINSPKNRYSVKCPNCDEITYFMNKYSEVHCVKCGKLLRNQKKKEENIQYSTICPYCKQKNYYQTNRNGIFCNYCGNLIENK